MSRKPPGHLDRMLGDGSLYHLAHISKNQADLARRCGVSPDAFISWRLRYRIAHGVPAPSFAELQGGMPLEKDWPPVARGVLTDEQQERVAQAFHGTDRAVGYGDSSTYRSGTSTSRIERSVRINPDRDDFEDEEPTQPAATSAWGAIPSLPPSTFERLNFPDRETKPPVQFASGSAIYRTSFDEPHNTIRHLTREDCPDGSLILWASDIHIPIQNDPVCRLMVECAERAGVTRVVAGGDILDMNCLSKHAKESRRTVEHATVLEEVEPGRWLLDWFATKQTDLLLGNHEDRLKRFIDENPAFHGSVASNFAQVCNLPPGINVLDGEVRLGNLSMFHGHAEFKNGTGGKYPAQRILELFPDQSSIHGHLHRCATAWRTTRDEHGVQRTRRVWSMPHLSLEHMHYGYVSRSPNWQTGFGLIRVYWEDDRPRWTVYQIEVLFDRHGRPFFEFENRVYR